MHEPGGIFDGGSEPQDIVGLVAPVPEDWLSSFSELEAARKLKALEADTERLTRVMYAGYQGRAWDEMVDWLALYGVAVLTAWAECGVLRDKVRARGFGRLPATRRFRDPVEARSLANETVASALSAFRDRVLVPGVWDPTRGATLRTFFIGQCLLQVRNIYRRGLAGSDLQAEAGVRVLHERERVGEDPANVCSQRDEARRALSQLPASQRHMVLLRASGMRDREVAVALDISEDAVRKTLYRVRTRMTAA